MNKTVTAGAENRTLCDLSGKFCITVLDESAGNSEQFRRWIAVVQIHANGGETESAPFAWFAF